MKIYLLISIFAFSFCFCVSNHNTEDGNKRVINNDYARLFSISDSGSYYRLDIYSPWQGADNIEITYYLSENKDLIPGNVKESSKIKLPINKSVCLSTTHVAMIEAAGSLETIIGVSGTDYVSNSLLREKIEKGKVKDVGYDSNLNTELITSLNPDIVFVYGIGPESAGYMSKLEKVGIPTLFICDYLEVHPLAKCEWMKLFGVLFASEDVVNSNFLKAKTNYESLRDSIKRKISSRPEVMLGLPYKDKWFISPGNSYVSALINDAGGEYVWSDRHSYISMPLGIESVFRQTIESEYWLNIGNVRTVNELLALDNRFAELGPVKSGKLYNNVARLSENGGNDYWESGAVRPDLVLRDIASILHPDIITNHELYYYLKVK